MSTSPTQVNAGKTADAPDIHDAEAMKARRADEAWFRWVMQTARKWDDVSGIIKKTNLESIDFDHRKLTELALEISNMVDMMQDGGLQLSDIEEQRVILNNLYSYAARHFARELQIIKKFDLPGFEEQRKQHKIFMLMVKGYINDFENGRLAVSMNLKNSILEWWIRHINEVDYNTFCLESWTGNAINKAENWQDISHLIRRTGIVSIDREQRALTESLLQLGKASAASFDDAKVAIETLSTCAKRLFESEETFITRHQLDGVEKQQEQHAMFMDMVNELRDNTREESYVIEEDTLRVLLQTWINHVNEADYETLSLELIGETVLSQATSWEEASDFIKLTVYSEIDEDHRHITEHIVAFERTLTAAEDGDDATGIHQAGAYFETLHDLCAKHFSREEQIMRETDYSGLPQHKEQHDKFLNTLKKNLLDISNGRLAVTKSVKMQMLDWWVRHIGEYDMRAFSSKPKESGYIKATYSKNESDHA